jgi:hypothetical protein
VVGLLTYQYHACESGARLLPLMRSLAQQSLQAAAAAIDDTGGCTHQQNAHMPSEAAIE